MTLTNLGSWNALRGRAEAARGGGQAVANIGKIAQTQIMKLSVEIAVDLLGPAGMLSAPDGVDGGRYTQAFVFAPASSIYGGTDAIQRNIVGERSLGCRETRTPTVRSPTAGCCAGSHRPTEPRCRSSH